MIAEGAEIYLDKLSLADIENFLVYRQDPDVCKYQGYNAFTKQEAIDFIEKHLPVAIGSRGQWTQIGIYSKTNNTLIGDCVSNFQQDEPKNIELGISINPKFQNKGLGSDTIQTLSNYLVSNFDVHKFIARIDARNQACIHLFKKLGFEQEGQLKENFFDKDDQIWVDLLMFGKIL